MTDNIASGKVTIGVGEVAGFPGFFGEAGTITFNEQTGEPQINIKATFFELSVRATFIESEGGLTDLAVGGGNIIGFGYGTTNFAGVRLYPTLGVEASGTYTYPSGFTVQAKGTIALPLIPDTGAYQAAAARLTAQDIAEQGTSNFRARYDATMAALADEAEAARIAQVNAAAAAANPTLPNGVVAQNPDGTFELTPEFRAQLEAAGQDLTDGERAMEAVSQLPDNATASQPGMMGDPLDRFEPD